jgi:hypothetical protein
MTTAMMSATTISIGSSRISGLFDCLPDLKFLCEVADAPSADAPFADGGGGGAGSCEAADDRPGAGADLQAWPQPGLT